MANTSYHFHGLLTRCTPRRTKHESTTHAPSWTSKFRAFKTSKIPIQLVSSLHSQSLGLAFGEVFRLMSLELWLTAVVRSAGYILNSLFIELASNGLSDRLLAFYQKSPWARAEFAACYSLENLIASSTRTLLFADSNFFDKLLFLLTMVLSRPRRNEKQA